MSDAKRLFLIVLSGCFAVVPFQSESQASSDEAKDIRKLSQHFIEPGSDISPWMIVPEDNIKSITTDEHPGLLTIWEAGNGKDLKGILDEPIQVDDYPIPWNFHLGILQNHLAFKGLSENQINYAIGLNLVVTYSDPSTWPEDRTQLPPDTESLQVFVVHLGNQGENWRQGIPHIRNSALNMNDPSPEVYMIYGRGDLAPSMNGNWKWGYTWVGPEGADSGSWSKYGGPADYNVRFIFSLMSPNNFQVGVGYSDHPGWRMRSENFPRPITGIWEIGPIIALDSWISDVLSEELGLTAPDWMRGLDNRAKLLTDPGRARDAEKSKFKPTTDDAEFMKSFFTVESPDPSFQYYVDYAVFTGTGPENIEHVSEDFNIPGFLADQKYMIEGLVFGETHSNPGYMTMTSYGNRGTWAICPMISPFEINFTKEKKPPFEISLAFIPPNNNSPWNLWWNVGLWDHDGNFHPWQPRIEYIPGEGMKYSYNPNPLINLKFDPDVSETLDPDKPIGMVIQVMDEYRLRLGFRNGEKEPWQFSSVFNSKDHFGKIAKFAFPALVSNQGTGNGNYPGYQKFLIDYIHYHYELSKEDRFDE